MKKIIASAGILLFVGAVLLGATGAFFSDVENSTGNTFTAGSVNVTLANSSFSTDPLFTDGRLKYNPTNSWALADLTNQVFFNFSDLKPNDVGSDLVTINNTANPVWACLDFTITGTPENGQSEPETSVDATTGTNQGELQEQLFLTFWSDDGDGVYENGENSNGGFLLAQGVDDLNGNSVTLSDGVNAGILTDAGTPIAGLATHTLGKHWCFLGTGGTIDVSTAPAQDGFTNRGPLGADNAVGGTGADADRGTGVKCLSGSGVAANRTQTDGVAVNVGFVFEQARNNSTFSCN